MTIRTTQGPNVSDPEARALLAASDAASSAGLQILTAVRDGSTPDMEEVVTALCDAIRLILIQYPGPDDSNQLLGAVLRYLDEETL
jgi:hypothetical protein